MYLPNYGVFDEQRYFQAGTSGAVLDLGSDRVGLTICEDIWEPGPPASDEALAGATLIVNISASPYHAGKGMERERMFAQRARDNVAYVAFCGLVGGQDELVFDGDSCVFDHTGTTIARAAQFRSSCCCATSTSRPRRPPACVTRPTAQPPGRSRDGVIARSHPLPSPAAAADKPPSRADAGRAARPPTRPRSTPRWCWASATTSSKNGFGHVVLGISGGIDSALVACLAVDALGPMRVSAAMMPSRYSSAGDPGDARALAEALGDRGARAPDRADDGRLRRGHARASSPDATPDLTEENLQARIRGNMLMALSNKFGWLVLTTGNKSEMSVGYTTLYGDLAGGFAVIKDVPKTLVYRLCAMAQLAGPAGRTPKAAARAVQAPIPESDHRAGTLGRAAPRPARR